ncbi:MAG: hypothetical protein Q8O67_14140 [Deltaproteobacteria bacterium]|nr:hypothetical protein [Deltaproteobacteria bacterium]
MRGVVVVVAVGFFCAGCPVWIEGGFDDVTLQLESTAVAVFDAHDVLERDGALIPVQRAPRDRRVHLWLSGADLPETEDWQHLEDERLLDVKQELASNDLLVLRNLSFDDLNDGDDIIAASDDADEGRAFDLSLSHRRLDDDVTKEGLGARITVEVEPIQVDEEIFQARLFVRRARAVGQPANDVVTGEVILTLALGLTRERLGEANLAFVAPIAACGQERGPGASLSCKEAPREPIVDETGAH